MSFNAGETIGQYRITEQLGQGGMATVYKAYHAALDRYVALKVLHPAFQEDSNFLARFQREARVVARLEHPNIVPIYDYAEHEGRPYLVMKFIEGETLKARLGNGPVEAGEVGQIVESIGSALAYAHKQGILHRDIKPSNVLLAKDGGIYLADFGLARIAQSGESTLTSDMILGTPQYISPEQALGKKDLDEGTDIYSFGVMLYELMVGTVPFNADTPFSVIHDHIYTPLPVPHLVNPNVSDEMERVLLKALSKERQDRYKDIRSLVDAFQDAWQGGAAAGGTTARRAKSAAKVVATPAPTVPAAPLQAVSAAPTLAAEKTASDPGAVEEGSGAPVKAKRTKRPFNWMWPAVGVILLIAGVFTFTALWSIPSPAPLAKRILPGENETPARLQTPQAPSDIALAQQKVAQNPDDPKAYLQLALAYDAANQPEKVQQAVTDIERLAAGNADFFLQAGKDLAGQGSWLASARMFLDFSEQLVKNGQQIPDDLRIQLHEAVYKAFKDQKATDYISFERLDAVDGPLQMIAKSRNMFYKGDKVQAQSLLDQLMQSKPGLADGQLLQADFSAKAGDTVRARQALADLRKNPQAAPWMLTEANLIEGNLP